MCEVISSERGKKIDCIIHEIDLDNIFKKFDNDGCMHIKYNGGRIYRRNNIFFKIENTYDVIYLYDSNMDPMYKECNYDSELWCDNCHRYYDEETGTQLYLTVSEVTECIELPFTDIIRIALIR